VVAKEYGWEYGVEFWIDSDCNLADCETTVLELVVMYLSQRLHGAREREKENENGAGLSWYGELRGWGARTGPATDALPAPAVANSQTNLGRGGGMGP
jgi:hypothetical protein